LNHDMSMRVIDSTFINNKASDSGGAISINRPIFTTFKADNYVNYNRFVNNTAIKGKSISISSINNSYTDNFDFNWFGSNDVSGQISRKDPISKDPFHEDPVKYFIVDTIGDGEKLVYTFRLNTQDTTKYRFPSFKGEIYVNNTFNRTFDTSVNNQSFEYNLEANITIKVDNFNYTSTVHFRNLSDVHVSSSGSNLNEGTEDSPFNDLNTAINCVKDGGTIHILDDLNLSKTVNIFKNIKIQSDNGGLKILDGNNMQIFNISPIVKVNVAMNNLKLVNGYSITSGGAIFNNGSDLNLYDCVIDSSTASNGDGRGVFITGGGTNHIVNCSFTNNQASNRGGGISITNTSTRCYINDCNFTNNRASNGGGIHSGKDYTPIFNCSITNNHADSNGGGVYVNKGLGKFIWCNISNNNASDGGGVNINEGVADFLDCNITFNSATDGGGVSIVYGTGDITTCEVSYNNATYGGGVKNGRADYYYGFCTIGASDLRYNTAAIWGGGIYNDNTGDLKVISLNTPIIKNKRTSFYYNKAVKDGGGIYDSHGKLFFNGTSLHYNSVTDVLDGFEGGGISSYSSEVYEMFNDQSINHMSDNTPKNFKYLPG